MKFSRRAEIATGTLIVLGLVAVVGFFVAKPAWADKRSRQAEQSKAATAEVEQAVAKAVEGEQKKGAVVAASVAKMGEAAAEAGDKTPWALFVQREAGHVAPLLPPPDYAALLAAEQRKRAVLEGRIEQADKLYAAAAASNGRLIEDNAKLRAAVAKSIADRREVDGELAESAAYARGVESQRNLAIVLVVLVAAGWLYAKITGFGRADIARIANRVRGGMSPMDAIDAAIPDWQHAGVAAIAAKLRSTEAAKEAARKAAAAS